MKTPTDARRLGLQPFAASVTGRTAVARRRGPSARVCGERFATVLTLVALEVGHDSRGFDRPAQKSCRPLPESLSRGQPNSGVMSVESPAEGNPMAALSTYLRILWREIVSIVALSVLFSLATLSVVPMGAAMIALVDAFYTSVTFTGTGGGIPPRTIDRANYFMQQIWTYMRTGLVYTVVLLLSAVGLVLYPQLALFGGSVFWLLFGIVGVYATVLILVLSFRAGNLVVHAEERDDDRPGFRAAMGSAWSQLRDSPAYLAAHLVTATTIAIVCRAFPLSLVFVLPGLLGLLEVVMYEELDGVGAKAIRYAYEDPQT